MTDLPAFKPHAGQRSACWIWPGYITSYGYGVIQRYRKKSLLAHRVIYEATVGDIPNGLQIDHLCRNRSCINPNHMEIVNARTNTLRGIGPTATNARKTHCSKGHRLMGTNLYTHKNRRRCRTCDVNRAKKRRRHSRAACRGER